MAVDYAAIRAENERRYGTDIGRIGPMLLANRYEDRPHFIYELLQNAEDALARRHGWRGSRAVNFELLPNELRVSHFGEPFTEEDVRGICGIGEGTKEEFTAIGRFGIGFKSVYAFTDRPEIHSGEENFAIENFVWPTAVPSIERAPDETVILIPLKEDDPTAHDDIANGLSRLGASTLLFLRQIEEIQWSVKGGRSGIYLRDSRTMAPGVRRVTVIGQEHHKNEIDEEEWPVFSRPVKTDSGRQAGHVEIAFRIRGAKEDNREGIQPVPRSPLVVYFPTIVETHLGFRIQGPYRTTPSRDNVPKSDPWNLHLVSETELLLVEALKWLRDNGLLDVEALQCLPLDRDKFDETSMFAPLFETTKEVLSTEPLLPRFEGGYVPASRALLGRGQELRELFTPTQLSALFGEKDELAWLSGDITLNRTPKLREYLLDVLDVTEVTPETIIPRLNEEFLEAQPDEWILKLYEFLKGQPRLLNRLYGIPLIRLEDGRHVRAREDGQPAAFLPGEMATGFPTVRPTVCATEVSRDFLRSLGLTEPDLVDDVILNVLPKYQQEEVDVSDADYEADVRSILNAFATDSMDQRNKLVSALRRTTFVRAVDAGTGTKSFAPPGDVYLATERLKELFTGVEGVLLVDDTCPYLRGEKIRELLEACGTVRYLRPVEDRSLSRDELAKLREQAGHAETSGYNDRVMDWTLHGLGTLLSVIPQLEDDQRRIRARLLWEELINLEERRGKAVFIGEYTWTHYGSYRTQFDAVFVRRLNEIAWVPDENGELQRPEFVLFDSLGWKPDPFLQSKIRFKPPVIEQLAKEAEIDPGVLNLLKQYGITSEEELKARLRIADSAQPKAPEDLTPTEAIEGILGPGHEPSAPQTNGLSETVPVSGSRASTGSGSLSGVAAGDRAVSGPGRYGGTASDGDSISSHASGGKARGKTSDGAGSAPFISYVAVNPDDQGTDPDGLEQEERLALEEQAIAFILEKEPNLQRTSPNNPGFDLIQTGPNGVPVRWIEVKAMTGDLSNRPVGLSRAQFEEAQRRGDRYWLYIVEHANTPERARVVRIQNPAGKAQTFTFDHGWISVAEIDQPVKPTQMKGST